MMMQKNGARRLAIKRILSLAVVGGLGTLRAGVALAAAGINKLYGTRIPGVQGKVISRQDGNYELWRRAMIWHHSKPKRYPEIIVQAQSENDVIAAVKYAAEKNLKVSVRAGGHNSACASVRHGGLVLDLSALNGIQVSPTKQVVSVQPGVRSLDLTVALEREGLSFPVPHCPSVSLSGFCMGGGIGWNYAQHGGMSTHSIVGADVVTADGKLITTNANESPDLFWALRGAGPGFFGVVTRLHLQTYPLPKAIMGSEYVIPLNGLETVTSNLEKIRTDNDVDRIELLVVLMHHPEVPLDAPPEESKFCFLTVFAFEDSLDAAKAALQPFSRSADLSKNSVAKLEYQELTLLQMYEKYFSLKVAPGRQARFKVDNVLTNDGSGTLLALADHLHAAPSKDCHILGSFNMSTKEKVDSCFSWAIDSYVGCYAIWDKEENDAANYEWLKNSLPLMDPFAVGHYVNEVEPRHRNAYRKCFSGENWQRLNKLREKYDPDGVFHTYLTQEEAIGYSG